MAEELNVDSIISRLLEGEFIHVSQSLVIRSVKEGDEDA